jgi:hypothetical protein
MWDRVPGQGRMGWWTIVSACRPRSTFYGWHLVETVQGENRSLSRDPTDSSRRCGQPAVETLRMRNQPQHANPETRSDAWGTDVWHHQPMTMLDSITQRAFSRSEPVSDMYNRMACNLSPADFDKQSRAMLQISTDEPATPKAPLEMTQESRGRRVIRRIRSWGYASTKTVRADASSTAHVIMMCESVSISNSGIQSGSAFDWESSIAMQRSSDRNKPPRDAKGSRNANGSPNSPRIPLGVHP